MCRVRSLDKGVSSSTLKSSIQRSGPIEGVNRGRRVGAWSENEPLVTSCALRQQMSRLSS